MSETYQRVLESKPVNRQAALVTSGGSDVPAPHAFAELDPLDLKRQARLLRNAAGEPLSKCRDVIAKQVGYESFAHYVRVLQSRCEYTNHQDFLARKRAKKAAKRHAERLAVKSNQGVRV